MLNGTSYFYGAAYHTVGTFSRLVTFANKFSDELDLLPFDRHAVLGAIRGARERLTEAKCPVDQEVALGFLMAQDLTKIESAIESDRIAEAIEAEAPFESNLHTCLEHGFDLLTSIGLDAEKPPIFIVDSVPPPYDKAGYKAVAIDEDDWKQHGIAPGLYFVRKHLRPFYSRALLLHELIHPFAAHKNPYLLGRGLEEGLAELLGSMYLSSKILGKDLATNIFIYNRLRFGFDQFWDLYLDFSRQATFLYNRFGLRGIASIVSGGRERIKEVELTLHRRALSSLELPSGDWDDDLTEVANVICMTFCRNLVVSPLARYLLPFVAKGKNPREILREANAIEEQGIAALQELQTRVVVAILKDDLSEVSLSDACLLSENAFVRYEIT